MIKPQFKFPVATFLFAIAIGGACCRLQARARALSDARRIRDRNQSQL